MRTIKLKEVLNSNSNTFSLKCTSNARGYITVDKKDIKIGDKIIINNYFTLVVE